MTDIFLSYSRADKEKAEAVMNVFASCGWTVWWDDEIATAQRWKDVLEQKIRDAKCVVVCWSENANKSQWVQQEAALARELNKYVPVSFDGKAPPGEFAELQATNLRNWYGGLRWPGLRLVTEAVSEYIGGSAMQLRTVLDRFRTASRWAMIWFLCSGLAFLYALSMWIASQNHGEGGFFVIKSDPVKGSLIALAIVSLLLIVASHYLKLYARNWRDEHWVLRTPRLGFARPDPTNSAARFQTGAILFLGAVFPAAALIHFAKKVLKDGKVARWDADVKSVEAQNGENIWLLLPSSWDDMFQHVYRFSNTVENAVQDGITFVPILTPYGISAAVILAWMLTIRALWEVIRPAGR
ncbi:MAG: toll/interleukin-1 receptor domain-containing protein [Hyphomicrobiales bacterium]|nr:toll/interleukin-1 receptor domain-containing protein [Hyphomicrobiales bacterium]